MFNKRDDTRIEALRQRLGARSKAEVLRSALTLLERQVARTERAVRWRGAARAAAAESHRVLTEFHGHSRLRHLR